MAWNVHQVFRAPAHLFDANVLHPASPARWPSPTIACCRRWPWRPSSGRRGTRCWPPTWPWRLACLLAALGGAPARPRPRAARRWRPGRRARSTRFHTYQVNEAPRLNIVAHGFIPFALAELRPVPADGRAAARLAHARASCCCRASARTTTSSTARCVLGLVAARRAGRAPAPRPRAACRALALAGAGGGRCSSRPSPCPTSAPHGEHGLRRGTCRPASTSSTTSRPRPPTSSMARSGRRSASSSGDRTSSASCRWRWPLLALGRWARRRPREAGPGGVPARSGSRRRPPSRCCSSLLSLGRDLTAWGHRLGPGPYRAAASLRARLPARAHPRAPGPARDAVRRPCSSAAA